MKRNLRMSSSILPSEICSGPKWEFAVKREMSLSELKMLAMANRASAISVGCHISHSSLGREELYWRKEKVWGKGGNKKEGSGDTGEGQEKYNTSNLRQKGGAVAARERSRHCYVTLHTRWSRMNSSVIRMVTGCARKWRKAQIGNTGDKHGLPPRMKNAHFWS